MFRIYKKQTVIFIVVEDMIRFFLSNIECFEYRMFWIPKSCKSNVLRCQSRTGELFYYQWPGFHQVIWEELQLFLCKFFWFTTSFSDFKLLNDTHREKLYFTQFSTRIAAYDLFYVFRQSIKFYTFHYTYLMTTVVWEMRFIK